jgi:hypothetical protein
MEASYGHKLSDLSYTIQGHQFNSDFRLLELQGYDIIFVVTGYMTIAQWEST